MQRKPVELHLLNGSYTKHPERKPKRMPPKPAGPLGACPKDFKPDERACWKELQAMTSLYSCPTDRWVAEAACRLMAKFRRDESNAAEIGKLITCMSLLGITPVDRGKLQVTNEKPADNPFEEFAA